ncbi:TlpA family protein disulfide reductase [Gelatiniphilus marinus]|uniref:TlpA family protein disulfide reductase n=1 Tax=Gelatiniphilus marinus TaxID=1759464 RepID=A0ABW5JN28_9FLAO
MKFKLLIIAILITFSCANKNKKTETAVEISKKEVTTTYKADENIDLEIYNYASFEKFLNKKDGKIYVINFWATWCAPCVKELPYFEKLNAEYKNKNVEVILVSLDFPHLYEKKLKPFIKEKQLKAKVIALDDADMNSWIPKIDKNWSGSIPATVIYKNDKRKFFEKSFNYEELESEVNKFFK